MIKIKANKERVTCDELNILEGKLAYKLPEDYNNFLLVNNGGEPELNIINIDNYGQVNVTNFFGVKINNKNNDIENTIEKYRNRVPKGYLPIADSEGGNLICLCINHDSYNKVYFWDHEQEADEEQKPSLSNMYEIANSFNDFFTALEKFDPSKVELHKEDVISTWIDPDFLKELNKG